MEKEKKIEYILYLGFGIFSFVFLFFFSYGTSPLFPTYGGDSEIFILVGKAITEGKLLYKDIFDHKGPILFFINALGYSIAGIKGIFFLQIINLTLVQILIYKIAKLFFKSPLLSLVPIAAMFIQLAFSIDDGDVSEEYSMPFIFLSIYLFIKYSFTSQDKHPISYAFVYGICVSIIALIRMNNAAAIGAIILVVTVHLFIKKEYKNLFANIGAFLGAMILVFGLISAYFIYTDTFNNFIYATFTFNFKYSYTYPRPSFWYKLTVLKNFITFYPILLLFFSLFVYRKQLNKLILIAFTLIGVLTFVAIEIGGFLLHYQMLNAVPFVLAIIITICIVRNHQIQRLSKYIVIICSLALSMYYTYHSRKVIWIYNLSQLSQDYDLYNKYQVRFDKKLVDKLIPLNERNSVFGYNVKSHWFLENDIIPSYRFFTNQDLWIMIDKDVVYDGINNYVKQTPPKWLIIPKPHKVQVGLDGNPVLKEIIEKDYTLAGKDIDYLYYHLKK